jgi:hypothetical protein
MKKEGFPKIEVRIIPYEHFGTRMTRFLFKEKLVEIKFFF